MPEGKKKIVVIGAGNVAWHIAQALSGSGEGEVCQIYSRTHESAAALAERIPGAVAVCDINDIAKDGDVYIVSIVDDGIIPLLSSLPADTGRGALWVHTSGSVGMDVLSSVTDKYGVFYPLQTFSKSVDLSMSEIPLFIEGVTPQVEDEIRSLGSGIFKNIYHADSRLRRKMHIAAVFACNFTNYLWNCASELLSEEGLSFDVLRPLLEETMQKSFRVGPAESQTGPARRGDKKIVDTHLSMLPPDKAQIYRMMSDKIMDKYR